MLVFYILFSVLVFSVVFLSPTSKDRLTRLAIFFILLVCVLMMTHKCLTVAWQPSLRLFCPKNSQQAVLSMFLDI